MAKKEINLLPIKNDYVFKRVFSYEGNEDVLIDLLEAILKRKINSLEVKNPEILPEKGNGKKFVLDIKAQLDDKTVVNIEMQTVNEKNIEERSLVYPSRLISEQLQAGEEYTNLNKAIFIGILEVEYYRRNSYNNIARLRCDEREEEYYVDMGYKVQDELATKYIEMHYIELPKYFKKKPDIRTKLDEWLWLFSGDEGKMSEVKKQNKKIEKAIDTLERISLDPKEKQMYEDIKTEEFLKRVSENNIRRESEEIGKAKGKKMGQEEKTKEIVRKMLKRNDAIEDIMEITELTKEKIEEIKAELT